MESVLVVVMVAVAVLAADDLLLGGKLLAKAKALLAKVLSLVKGSK